jgi:uncharacterized membrane protein YjfL (UPF0719 family)
MQALQVSGWARWKFVCDRQELFRGNRAVGVEFAGLFVAIAVILRAGLLGPSQGLTSDVTNFLVSALVGAVVLLLFQSFVRRFFLVRANLPRSLRDDNLAVALTLQALTLTFALLLAAAQL